jgi:hypothetical protein
MVKQRPIIWFTPLWRFNVAVNSLLNPNHIGAARQLRPSSLFFAFPVFAFPCISGTRGSILRLIV